MHKDKRTLDERILEQLKSAYHNGSNTRNVAYAGDPADWNTRKELAAIKAELASMLAEIDRELPEPAYLDDAIMDDSEVCDETWDRCAEKARQALANKRKEWNL